MKKVALYARCSTHLQETDNQLLELRRYVKARGWEAVEYIDRGISGAKGEDKRPALKSLLDDARRRKIDGIIVSSLDRLGRNLRALVEIMESLNSWGVSFSSLRESLDTTSPNGRLIFQIFGALAEFERSLIRSRVMLGLERARSQGRQFGRPKANVNLEDITDLQRKGLSLRQIARKLGVSAETIRRRIRLSQNPPANGGTKNQLKKDQ